MLMVVDKLARSLTNHDAGVTIRTENSYRQITCPWQLAKLFRPKEKYTQAIALCSNRTAALNRPKKLVPGLDYTRHFTRVRFVVQTSGGEENYHH